MQLIIVYDVIDICYDLDILGTMGTVQPLLLHHYIPVQYTLPVCMVYSIPQKTLAWSQGSIHYSIHKIQKHFQNVMLVGMASEISKKHTYKCVDRSVHHRIKGAKAVLLAYTFSHGTLDSVVY